MPDRGVTIQKKVMRRCRVLRMNYALLLLSARVSFDFFREAVCFLMMPFPAVLSMIWSVFRTISVLSLAFFVMAVVAFLMWVFMRLL